MKSSKNETGKMRAKILSTEKNAEYKSMPKGAIPLHCPAEKGPTTPPPTPQLSAIDANMSRAFQSLEGSEKTINDLFSIVSAAEGMLFGDPQMQGSTADSGPGNAPDGALPLLNWRVISLGDDLQVHEANLEALQTRLQQLFARL